ncbi:MAG: hypothetical protein KGL42_15815 [Betaproteobacteria bacterium]|nr:hypothetical protein [Betaproteobacteria bacterium]
MPRSVLTDFYAHVANTVADTDVLGELICSRRWGDESRGLASGKGDLIWRFYKPGTVNFACAMLGHLQAGMVGKILVE